MTETKTILCESEGASREDFDIATGKEIARRWRERVWGSSPEGDEHVLILGGEALFVTEGTGDGAYAYYLEDVALWLEEDRGLDADEWGRAWRAGEIEDHTSAPYQRFCDNVRPETADAGLARAVSEELGISLTGVA